LTPVGENKIINIVPKPNPTFNPTQPALFSPIPQTETFAQPTSQNNPDNSLSASVVTSNSGIVARFFNSIGEGFVSILRFLRFIK